MNIISVVGARPNFIKIMPIHGQLQQHANFEPEIVHTGQHYDEVMSGVFFKELDIPKPDKFLSVGSNTHARQTALTMTKFEEVLEQSETDLVLVVGDVNSTLAAALVAQKRQVPVAHVEAGLRSFDRSMAEEVNRVLTDHLADQLFVTEESAVYNLSQEGIPRERIHFVGNVMIDSLDQWIEVARERPILTDLGVKNKRYVVATLHRPANVDDSTSLRKAVDILKGIAEEWPVVFPVHPRTKKRLKEAGLHKSVKGNTHVSIIDPVGYLDFICLIDSAGAVITDSGGIQEETTVLGTPCLTLRESTERPVTVESGTNELVPLERELVIRRLRKRIQNKKMQCDRPPFWDGQAAKRIVNVLEQLYL